MPRKKDASGRFTSISNITREEELCIDYDGQAWNCPAHTPVDECPKCHCIKTTREHVGAVLPPFRHMTCNICGHSFNRNKETGEYC